jgi:hypothetical protein
MLGTYKEEVGPSACTACPAESTTAAAGATAVTLCLCGYGWTGIIETGADICTACDVGTYKPGIGPWECSDCPADSSTALPGSPGIGSCQCIPGYTGTIEAPADTCAACSADTYKPAPGDDPCLPCPVGETSPPGASACFGDEKECCAVEAESELTTVFESVDAAAEEGRPRLYRWAFERGLAGNALLEYDVPDTANGTERGALPATPADDG